MDSESHSSICSAGHHRSRHQLPRKAQLSAAAAFALADATAGSEPLTKNKPPEKSSGGGEIFSSSSSRELTSEWMWCEKPKPNCWRWTRPTCSWNLSGTLRTSWMSTCSATRSWRTSAFWPGAIEVVCFSLEARKRVNILCRSSLMLPRRRLWKKFSRRRITTSRFRSVEELLALSPWQRCRLISKMHTRCWYYVLYSYHHPLTNHLWNFSNLNCTIFYLIFEKVHEEWGTTPSHAKSCIPLHGCPSPIGLQNIP